MLVSAEDGCVAFSSIVDHSDSGIKNILPPVCGCRLSYAPTKMHTRGQHVTCYTSCGPQDWAKH